MMTLVASRRAGDITQKYGGVNVLRGNLLQVRDRRPNGEPADTLLTLPPSLRLF